MTTELFVRSSGAKNEGAFVVRLTGKEVSERLSKEGATFRIALPSNSEYVAPKTVDGFLFANIFEAMMIGEPFHVHGVVSARAIKNAALYCEAWHNLLPDMFSTIEITADAIVSDRNALSAGDDRAISAFSGGLDGMFTALRHTQRDLGEGSHRLDMGVMVHGLDVPPDNYEGFQSLKRRVEPVFDELSLPCANVWTNFRPLNRQPWEMSFSAQLAGCLHLMSGMYRYALVGSSEPYSDLVLPWGSNPATDYLLSGGAMEIVHDGAGFTRTAKAARIAQNQIATTFAKFCWEGPADKNCGVCEKCMRTRFNFLAAAGIEHPACFDQPLDLQRVPSIKIRSKAVYTEFKTVLRHAEKTGRHGAWLEALRELVTSYSAAYEPDHVARTTVPHETD